MLEFFAIKSFRHFFFSMAKNPTLTAVKVTVQIEDIFKFCSIK